ncbi:urea ABC transporter permease subunit UrtB [Actinomadura nitritigenes]|uniref:Branched-chain amino acid ABC transporter permease n=1 Tax=Actinomadura nitritigenes TaxID=134602 RepID=A0ABS3R2L8_9ACTN|nr:branched-chain amino acid ABC transporter permease [Actinomadura nitritigenes]MBO2440500.1 branched-chain amino acid ABC transporter permease [Actinomadura nitritigenes]
MTVLISMINTSATTLLVVMGLAIVLGLMHIVNLAQTGFMAVGVYTGLEVGPRLGFWTGALAAAVLAGLIGAAAETLLLRRVRERMLETMLATWGLSLILTQLITLRYGPDSRVMATPLHGSFHLFGTTWQKYRVLLVAAAVLLVAAMWALTRFTRVGLRVRMCMADPDLAEDSGINTLLVRQATFVLGCALAGFVGVLLGPISGIDPNFAGNLLIPAFLAVMMSGRTLHGLVISGITLSVVQVGFAYWSKPAYATVAVIAVAVVVLGLLPDGIDVRRFRRAHV